MTSEKKIFLKGFFKEYDKFNRAKILFIDEYDSEIKDGGFTKKYILNKSIDANGKSPLINDRCFNVKMTSGQVGYIGDEMVPVELLVQSIVELEVSPADYNFVKNGIRYKGWNLKLLSMKIFR